MSCTFDYFNILGSVLSTVHVASEVDLVIAVYKGKLLCTIASVLHHCEWLHDVYLLFTVTCGEWQTLIMISAMPACYVCRAWGLMCRVAILSCSHLYNSRWSLRSELVSDRNNE